MNAQSLLVLALLAQGLIAGSAVAAEKEGLELLGKWNGYNDPGAYDPSYERRFSVLPLNGDLGGREHPWTDTFWPTKKGGIANRWNAPGQPGFKYSPPSREAVRTMSESQLAQLSPAEKYDISQGRYDYPLFKIVRGSTSPSASAWAGICNGWSPAAIHHREPQPVRVTNPDGVVVPFGSSDVKGLLSHFYAFEAETPVKQLGARCFISFMRGLPNCSDVNAGSLHIVLGNELGLRHTAFIVDRDRGREVWNQPVYGYESKVLSYSSARFDSAPGTAQRVLVDTVMYYTDEIEPTWEAVGGTSQFKEGKAEYRYWLELNAAGEIIGGDWESFDRPDFVWTRGKAEFSGYYTGLNQIYRTK